MEKIAVVGFGCAGYHALSALREAGSSAEIDVYSETGLAPYNPMLTTYYTAGKLPYEGMFPFGSLAQIAQRHEAHIITDTRVTAVDAADRTVVSEKGARGYDKILISTGATAFVPSSFAGLEGSFVMRTVEDAVKLREALAKNSYRTAVVVGASMVGVKVAELLYDCGIKVTLADMAPHIFALAAYPEVSQMLEERIRARGIEMAFGQAITGAESDGDGFIVRFADGSALAADLLILNIGTRAATTLLDPAEVPVDRGVLVDERMRTGHPNIWAAGDCCQGNNLQSAERQIIGLWANAGIQGRVAGRDMAGKADSADGNILHNITHFMDIDFIGLGDNRLTGEQYSYTSEDGRFYLQAVLRGGKPMGFNIIDNYGISGILKNHLIKRLRGERCGFTPEQRGQLRRYGVQDHFISKLEGTI